MLKRINTTEVEKLDDTKMGDVNAAGYASFRCFKYWQQILEWCDGDQSERDLCFEIDQALLGGW